MKTDILITLLSWEDRFIAGLKKNLQAMDPAQIIVLYYEAYSNLKSKNFEEAKNILGNRMIEIPIDTLDSKGTWLKFEEIFGKYCKEKKVMLDISTMTREAIWLSLFNCKVQKCVTEYIYYKPLQYGAWITRDPGRPRLLYKMSGIHKLNNPTALIVTAGFDIERLDSLIYRFEPRKTILFFQDGNDPRNIEVFEKCQELFKSKYNVDVFLKHDAYNVESSFELIEKTLTEEHDGGSIINTHNIIFDCLGAKISAITLFKLWLKYPEVALSYLPSKEYNPEYSSGIDQSFTGLVTF